MNDTCDICQCEQNNTDTLNDTGELAIQAAGALIGRTVMVWWLHRYIPGVPRMNFGQSVALVAASRAIIGSAGRIAPHKSNDDKRKP